MFKITKCENCVVCLQFAVIATSRLKPGNEYLYLVIHKEITVEYLYLVIHTEITVECLYLVNTYRNNSWIPIFGNT